MRQKQTGHTLSPYTLKRLPNSAQELISHYQSLHIQNLSIACPYHINSGLYGKNRALVGKGRPEEIEEAAERYLNKYQMYSRGDVEQLRIFMLACGIGIDCSGFAAWVLDCLTKEQLHKSIWQCLKFPDTKRRVISKIRPLESISASVLTNIHNTEKITDLQIIQPGDMIRLIHGHHVMVISEVGLDENNQVLYFKYVQSSISYGRQKGVDVSMVTVSNSSKYLIGQSWADALIYKDVQDSNDEASIVRLKALIKNL